MGDFDFIVSGSDAGGGPLAVNLALSGCSVGLIEAGGTTSNQNVDIPTFHPLATEDPELSWEFFVSHFFADAT